ncbi:MAG: iron-containing alcohol dehydrogenase [Candidatus Hinthialibacter antarcticus]|nr:iron-containing alcohol dehydrogenase [Candidatus Hinthialibacter antarcticus]
MNKDNLLNYQFFTPTRLIVGQGRFGELGDLASGLGKRAFVVGSASGKQQGLVERAVESLKANSVQTEVHIKPAGEPSVAMTDAAANIARKAKCDMVVSIGGGSVIDLGKAVAGLATNSGSVKDYLEGVGDGRTPGNDALPQVAVPTTAGTGAEVTRNAVISSKEEQFKKSFRSPTLYPKIAILDAELTVSLPPQATAYSGMDAITQLVESILTRRSNPITDALALFGLEKAIGAIRRVVKDGGDLAAREDMLLASTLSGVCLANAGLGIAHGFASGMGAVYDAPHGKICAILLPLAIRFNRCACFPKMVAVAERIVPEKGLPPNEIVDRALAEIEEMNKAFGIPTNFAEWKISDADLPVLARKSMGNSMGGNPSPVTESIAEVLLKSMR